MEGLTKYVLSIVCSLVDRGKRNFSKGRSRLKSGFKYPPNLTTRCYKLVNLGITKGNLTKKKIIKEMNLICSRLKGQHPQIKERMHIYL